MIVSAIAAKRKPRAKADFRGRHFEAALIVQALSWYLRYPPSYRDIEELLLERGPEVDYSTLNRWVRAYAPLIEKRLRQFRRPHCGSVRIDEAYIKVRGEWRYLYRAVDKHGTSVDFLLTANRDGDAAKSFFPKHYSCVFWFFRRWPVSLGLWRRRPLASEARRLRWAFRAAA